MLFEKTIRKNRISPFRLELIGGILLHGLPFVLFLSIIAYGLWCYYGFRTISFLVVMIVIFIIAVTIDMLPTVLINFGLRRDLKRNLITTGDFIIIDETLFFSAFLKFGEVQSTFTHLFFTEPCIRICFFDLVPIGTMITLPQNLMFYLPEVHFTYRKQKDYQKYLDEFNQLKEDVKNGIVHLNLEAQKMVPENELNSTIFYVTYDKMQAFNRLFELVNPPEFRFTFYENSEVLISIDPIPGKEYPPEALECMKKINAMYP